MVFESYYYDRLREIEDIGPIPAFGDNYYDGILEAHNDQYFITGLTEICECHAFDACHRFETIYSVYRMDDILRYLLSGKDSMLAVVAREYAEKHKEPIFFIRERNLNRGG